MEASYREDITSLLSITCQDYTRTDSLTHTSSSLTPSFPAVYNSPLTMMAESIRGVCGIELPRQRVLPCGCRSRSHRGMKRCGRLALTSLPLLLQPCYLRSTYHPVQTSSAASIICSSGTPHNALQHQILQIKLLSKTELKYLVTETLRLLSGVQRQHEMSGFK